MLYTESVVWYFQTYRLFTSLLLIDGSLIIKIRLRMESTIQVSLSTICLPNFLLTLYFYSYSLFLHTFSVYISTLFIGYEGTVMRCIALCYIKP